MRLFAAGYFIYTWQTKNVHYVGNRNKEWLEMVSYGRLFYYM